MSAVEKVVLLGVGQTARALVSYLANYYADRNIAIWGSTRAQSGEALIELGIKPILISQKENWQRLLKEACEGACVLVSFPPAPSPDQNSDQVLSEIVFAAQPKTVVYISSTGVYGKNQGVIDESSAVDVDDARALVRLKSEEIWARRAIILRAPGLYSSTSGMHKRLLSGSYYLPGDGSNYVSRIHLDDLAAIITKIFFAKEPLSCPRTYVVGDTKPSTHLEVVTWLCQQLSLPLPPSKPLSEVNPTLQGNRQICSAKILADLDLKLKYPTYVEGFSQGLIQGLD